MPANASNRYTARQIRAACLALDLELHEAKSEEEIRRAFRRLSLQHHPDRNQASELQRVEAEATFKTIARARDILTDRAARLQEESNERDAYVHDEVENAKAAPRDDDGLPTRPCMDTVGEKAEPTAGGCSQGWGPCPACGGLKRHVGMRACPVYGKWFEDEKRLGHEQQQQRNDVAKRETKPAVVVGTVVDAAVVEPPPPASTTRRGSAVGVAIRNVLSWLRIENT